MSDEQEPQSSPTTEQSQGVNTAATPAAEAQPDYKETLVKELMEGAEPSPPATPEAKPEEKAAEAKPSEPPKAPEAEAKSEEKAPDPATEEAVEAEPEEDEELQGPGENATQGEKIAWGKLKAKLKKTQEEGQFGHILAQVGAQAGISPDEMANWVGLGARMRAGDTTAKSDLLRMIGVNPVATKAPEPAVAPEEQVYTELFADAVNNADMTEEAARAKAKAIVAKYHKPEPEPEPTYTSQAAPVVDPVERAASLEIDRLDVQYSTKVPNWDKIRAEVYQTIATKHQGAPAIQWLPLFNETVREVQMKYTKPASAARVKPDSTLKPSASSSAATSGADWKSSLISDLMTGKV
jgi:hypothetical protein